MALKRERNVGAGIYIHRDLWGQRDLETIKKKGFSYYQIIRFYDCSIWRGIEKMVT